MKLKAGPLGVKNSLARLSERKRKKKQISTMRNGRGGIITNPTDCKREHNE